MGKPSGVVLWESDEIVCVAVGLGRRSKNAKTGAMVQTYILRKDRDPWRAVKDGSDRAVCGDCPQRPSLGGACYVQVQRAPVAVWKAWRRGLYPALAEEHRALFEGRRVRLGSYGDPAFVPLPVWQRVLSWCAGHTGYTHQWAACDEGYRVILMASADSAGERDVARALGWRTFRVRAAVEPIGPREVTCPASAEAGKRRTCETCGACDGAGGGASRASVAIVAHGWKAKSFERRRLPVLGASL